MTLYIFAQGDSGDYGRKGGNGPKGKRGREVRIVVINDPQQKKSFFLFGNLLKINLTYFREMQAGQEHRVFLVLMDRRDTGFASFNNVICDSLAIIINSEQYFLYF